MKNEAKTYWIDLFCGAGGTTTGIHIADVNTEVIACVNHNQTAIESHKANYPDCLHLVEDVRDFRVVQHLKRLVGKFRREHPGCFINIWASLECTNYSKAKGGLPRDADSRTLAEALYMYMVLEPDYVFIENVREFMAWGPLDENGRPISRKNGRDYIRWLNKMKSYGYDFDHKILNAADFGAFQRRERYFGQFAKKGLPIAWPEPTHVKTLPEDPGLFETTKKKWRAVREVLDLEDEGRSVFDRKIPLVENTLKRIYAGLVKFVAGGEHEFLYHNHGGDPNSKVWSTKKPNRTVLASGNHYKVKSVFLKKYYSGRPAGKVISVEGPCGTVTTIDGHAVVTANFIKSYYSGGDNHRCKSIDEPCNTIRTNNCQALVSANFLQSYNGNGGAHSIEEPCPTLTTKDRLSKVEAQFLTNYYSGGGQYSSIEKPSPTVTVVPKQRLTSCTFIDQQYGQSKPKSIEDPSGTITTNPKLNVVTAKPWIMDTNFNNVGSSLDELSRTIVAARKHHYLMNPQFKSKGSSIDAPAPTLIARTDKKPLYVVTCEKAEGFGVIVYEDDSETMVKIKEFMAAYGIVDIKMRMFHIAEMLRIQGFPENYILKGTKTEQKKQIGNAVEVHQAVALVEANYKALENYLKVAV